MDKAVFYSSLTRISDLATKGWEVEPRGRANWENGDYILGSARNASAIRLELDSGRHVELLPRDLVVGALGHRAATLEAVGSFADVGDDMRMQLLTGAGLVGRVTSMAPSLPRLVELEYRGHVVRGGQAVRMADHACGDHDVELNAPVVLIVGTSMSAGKTTTARFAIRALKLRGLRVTGAKLTGAGRYKDILSMRDAGADAVFDFVDGGLPSSICPADEYLQMLRRVLSAVAESRPDVVVVEAGSSPLEPYNAEILIGVLGDSVRCRLLAATDPFAVAGVQKGFGWQPDLVTGPAANTSAAVSLVRRLTGLVAVNVLEVEGRRKLDALLGRTLGV